MALIRKRIKSTSMVYETKKSRRSHENNRCNSLHA
ncbi:hypothetical protein ACT7DN_31710 [Bacillus paranthracis]